MSPRPVNVALIGLGTVGGGLAQIILEHGADMKRHQGIDIRLAAVADLYEENAAALGLSDIFTTDSLGLCAREDIDIVVELIGGCGIARKVVLTALENGKHVVTANKALLAKHGKEIFELAEEKGLAIGFEASCGGAIPIIGPLKHQLVANRIDTIMGIVNGTTNYMLTRMSREGMAYDDVLKIAQELGYAEADPSGDVEGHDAANKIAIMASIAFNSRVTVDQVPTFGITDISPVDLKHADDLGYAIKLLAIANRTDEGIDVRVHPAMVEKSHPLATVDDSFNAIFVVGDYVDETMFYGRGAGSKPTASAVCGDVFQIARYVAYGQEIPYGCSCTDELPVLSMDNLSTKYYMRFGVEDRPGVLTAATKFFTDHNVSVSSFSQESEGEGATAQMIFLTHEAKESDIQAVMADLAAADFVVEKPVLIRTV